MAADPMPGMTDWELDLWTETLMAVTECDDAAGIVNNQNAAAWRAEQAVRDARRGRS